MDQVDPDTLRVLVATDIHLGFLEKDEIRGNDSFKAFDEICSIAIEQKVDFMLLGGDLFHENKPSRSTLVKTIEILRRYCLSDRPVQFEVVSDQSANFDNKFALVNYEDPNFKIGLPVFVIHGNHDDPAGVDNLSSLDILSASNLLNYFGKVGLAGSGVGQITLHPILIRKGSTRVALYGLGNIRDERLNRMFQTPHGVEWIRPENQENCTTSDWFNMFVLHQNRVKSNPKNAINESFLAGFLDFVIWGHEHECLVEPQEIAGMGFHITQPGSSVATSLTDGEAKPKHVLLLEIKGNQYRPTKIPLQSVRPFEFTEVSLKDDPDLDPNDPAKIAEFLGQVVQESIARASAKVVKKEPMMPLIRIKVDYSGFTTINPQRFGQKFVGKVANPHDLLLFTKQAKKRHSSDEKEDKQQMLPPEELNQQNIEALLAESNLKMEILPMNDLAMALHDFVNKDDKQAFITCVQQTLEETRSKLVEEEEARNLLEEKDLAAKINEHMLRREAEKESRAEGGMSAVGRSASASGQQKAATGARAGRFGSQVTGDDDEDFAAEPSTIASGRGKRQSQTAARRPAAAAASRGRGRGRALKQTTLDLMPRTHPSPRAAAAAATATLQGLSDDETEETPASHDDVLKNVEEVEDSDMEVEESSKGRKRQASGRGRGRSRGSAASAPAKRGRKSTNPAGRTTSYIDDDDDDNDDEDSGSAGRGSAVGRTPSKAPVRRNYGPLRK